MGIVKTARLIYEYIRHDEEEKIKEVKRAIDGVDLDIEDGYIYSHLRTQWIR